GDRGAECAVSPLEAEERRAAALYRCTYLGDEKQGGTVRVHADDAAPEHGAAACDCRRDRALGRLEARDVLLDELVTGARARRAHRELGLTPLEQGDAQLLAS